MPSKLSNEVALERLIKRCQETNYTFNGFENEKYDGKFTKLKLKCNECNKTWETTNYDSFVNRKRKVHSCKRVYSKITLQDKIINNINKYIDTDKFIFQGLKEEYKDYNSTVILITCKKCNNTFEYSYPQFMVNKGVKECKYCENNRKLDVKTVLNNINTKCSRMNYTFLGFDNEENRYTNSSVKLILKCNKCGRIWKTTTYDRFLRKVLTCDGCNKVWKLEKELELFFEDNNETFVQQKTFDWLKYKNNMFLDFYLPKYNVAIECQGKEHFEPIDAFGGEKTYSDIHKRDILKNQLCKEHGIKLLYYTDIKQYNTFLDEQVFKNKTELIKTILNG